MHNFIFRCPATGLNVQGSVTPEEVEGRKYVAQACPACGALHLVDPAGDGAASSKDREAPDALSSTT